MVVGWPVGGSAQDNNDDDESNGGQVYWPIRSLHISPHRWCLYVCMYGIRVLHDV